MLAQLSQRPSLGVSFSDEFTEQQIINLIPDLQDLGIYFIELTHPVSHNLINKISNLSFQLFIRSDIKFLTESEINNSEKLTDLLLPYVKLYSAYPVVTGIGLTSFSSFLDAHIITQLYEIQTDISNATLYEINTATNPISLTIIDARSFSENPQDSQFLFEAPYQQGDLQLVKSINRFGSDLILFDYSWLVQAMENESYLRESLITFADSDDQEILLANSETENSKSIPDWPVIILVLLWLSLGIHIKSNPTYGSLILRYFSFHRFFVDDIMRYRERSSTPGVTLFIQHSFFTGLIIYILGLAFISERGLEAFYFHFPVLAVFGENYFTLFASAVILTLIFGFLSLLWLYIPSKSMNHFSQVLSLNSWIFHIDFLLVSSSLVLLKTESSAMIILFFCGLHFLIWIIGFIVAAYDSSQYLTQGKVKYLTGTAGLFILLIGVLLMGFLFSGRTYDILQLVTSL